MTTQQERFNPILILCCVTSDQHTAEPTWNDPNSCSSCRASQGCGLMSLRAAVLAVRSGKRNSVPA